MTRETSPGCTLLSVFYRRPKLMHGIGWIGGIGVLSSGIVWAQTDGGVDTLGSPRSQQTTPRAKTEREPPALRHSTPERQPQPDFVRRPRAPEIERELSVIRRRFAAPESQGSADLQPTRPRLRPPNFSGNETKPARSREIAKSYNNNGYIDSTDYNIGATARSYSRNRSYDAPDSVVLSERSTGCRRVLGSGQGLGGGICGSAVGVASGNDNSASRNRLSRQPDLVSRRQRLVADVESRVVSRWQWPVADRAPARYAPPPRASVISESGLVSRRRSSPVAERIPTLMALQPRASAVDESNWISRWRGPVDDNAPVQAAQPRRANVFQTALVSSRRRESVASINAVNIGPVRVSARGIGFSSHTQETEEPQEKNWISLNPQNSNSSSSQPFFNPKIPLPLPATDSNNSFIYPLSLPAPITSLFGWRIHPLTGDRRFHAGIDLGAPMGTPVLAAYAGQVAIADWLGGYGLAVVLQHNQTQQTLYGHLSEVFVQPGQWVDQGTAIGKVGSTGNSTGPHLHFEWRHMTAEGWVATDPGTQLQYALSQMMQALQTAQSTSQPGT